MFHLKTLGALSLYRTEQPDAVVGGSKPLMLLALLATMSDHSSTREHMAQLLWPDADNVRSRRSLRQALFHISKHAGQDVIQSDESHSTLALDEAILSVDLWEFDRALKEEDYERAIDLYDGPFLKGFERKAGREVEHQIEAENSRIRVGLEVAYTKLVSRALSREDYERAVRWARQFVDLNPLDDRAQATLVRALKASGDEVGALATYQGYRTLLQQTLEEEPDADLQEAMERVREEILARSAAVEDEEEETDEAELAEEGEGVEEAGERAAEEEAGAEVAERAAAGRTERHERAPGRATVGRRVLTTVVLGIGVPALILAVGATAWSLWTLRRTAAAPATFDEVYAIVGAETGGQIARLTGDGSAVDVEPTGYGAAERPSPDGTRVAFNVRAPDGWNLAIRDAGSTDTTTLTDRAGDEYPEGWSPDGRYLLYWEVTLLAGGRDRTHRLMVWDTLAGRGRPLTRLESRTVPSATWSPDGTRIAFVADIDGQPDVFVVDFDGDNLTNVSRNPAKDLSPAWAPDGNRLAFVSDREGTQEIYSVRRDGSDLQRISETEGAARTPLWTSASKLLFVLETENGHDLWRAEVGGAEAQPLTRRGDIASLLVNMNAPARRAWIDRVEIVADARAVSPGQHFQLTAVVVDAAGDSLPRSTANIEWSVADPDIIEADPFGYHVLSNGPTTIVASAAGWRADTLRLVSLPLVERRSEILLDETWRDSLDSERWQTFGQPAPTTRPSGGPDGGGVFLNNGDAHFESGVVSRQVFPLDQGLGVEVYGRMSFTRRLFQTFAIALYPRSPPDSLDWLAASPLLELVLAGPSANDSAVARVSTPTWNSELPFPDSVASWRRYTLQTTPDGVVEVIIDGRLHWRSPWRLPLDSIGSARVALGYQSFETEIAHGPLQVYRPPRRLFVAVDSSVASGTQR